MDRIGPAGGADGKHRAVGAGPNVPAGDGDDEGHAFRDLGSPREAVVKPNAVQLDEKGQPKLVFLELGDVRRGKRRPRRRRRRRLSVPQILQPLLEQAAAAQQPAPGQPSDFQRKMDDLRTVPKLGVPDVEWLTGELRLETARYLGLASHLRIDGVPSHRVFPIMAHEGSMKVSIQSGKLFCSAALPEFGPLRQLVQDWCPQMMGAYLRQTALLSAIADQHLDSLDLQEQRDVADDLKSRLASSGGIAASVQVGKSLACSLFRVQDTAQAAERIVPAVIEVSHARFGRPFGDRGIESLLGDSFFEWSPLAIHFIGKASQVREYVSESYVRRMFGDSPPPKWYTKGVFCDAFPLYEKSDGLYHAGVRVTFPDGFDPVHDGPAAALVSCAAAYPPGTVVSWRDTNEPAGDGERRIVNRRCSAGGTFTDLVEEVLREAYE